MEDFCKQRAMNMIWVSNKLEGTLPTGVTQFETFKILEKIYNGETVAVDVHEQGDDSDRKSRRQLRQHFEAFMHLCSLRSDTFEPLTEDLVKSTHGILMKGLVSDDGNVVNAGVYRKIPVHAGSHQFPHFECVATEMPKILSKYEEKFQDPKHSPFQLASWLLFEVVSLHPFEDGNGRLCRLLWCYSLMRDGLPFPLTPSSGHSKAQKHYVSCIERDQKRFDSNQPFLTTLTVVSVDKVWNNFYLNLKYELPD